MKDYNEVFGYEAFAGFMTAAQLKRHTECIREYRGYSIAFGNTRGMPKARHGGASGFGKTMGRTALGLSR